MAPVGPDGEEDFLSELDRLRGLSLLEDPEMGTRAGMSLGGKVLKPGLESRPDSLELCPWELGRFSESEEVFSEGLSAPAPASFFSKGGMMGFDGEVSLPMALQVWANRARGLFSASNCENKGKKKR